MDEVRTSNGDEILVSVVCIAYNHGKYITDALNGFVNQKTNFKYEVIVHDDASTDNTADIIREYEQKYPDLIIGMYETVNQHSIPGVSIRRIVSGKIRGKYVALCEGDDYWIDEKKLQKQVSFLEANPEYSLCATSAYCLNELTGQKEMQYVTAEDKDISIEELILESRGRIFTTCSVVYKTEIHVNYPSWGRVFPYGDRPRWMWAAHVGKIRMLHDITAVYRHFSEGSWTLRVNNNNQIKVNVIKRTIQGFEAFNQATNYQYDSAVKQTIRKSEFDLKIAEKRWNEIDLRRDKDVFKYLTTRAKIMVICEKYFPRLMAIYRKGK